MRNHFNQQRGHGLLGREFNTAGTSSEFPFSMDVAGSKQASNSKLDVRPVEVESRQSAKEMRVVVRLRIVLDSAVPKGAPRAWIGTLGFQMRTGGYYRIWGDIEGPPTHSGFEV
jgi:hypothetical protein